MSTRAVGPYPTSAYQTNSPVAGSADQVHGPHAPKYFWIGGGNSAGANGMAQDNPIPTAIATALTAEGYTVT